MRLPMTPGAVGADEAGRGPLAGPVVAAAVVLPESFDTMGLNDSKQLDPARREELFTRIQASASWAISFSDPVEIDRINILHASMTAMARAISALWSGHTSGSTSVGGPETQFSLALIDGNRLPAGLPCPGQAVVKGDGKHAEIAAASILAKVTRDRYMVALASEFPDYGFERHFGYPTPDHLAALSKVGPCPHHRRSFRPVYEAELAHGGKPDQGALF